MKNNTRKTFEKQNFPEDSADFLLQIFKLELCATHFKDQDSKKLGLNRGDIVLYRQTKEINENQLTILEIPKYEYPVFGFAYENFDQIGILSATTGKHIGTFKKREVKIYGLIVGVVKPFDAQKLSSFPYQSQSEEITAVCRNCQATLSGTSEFIKSQGWTESLCLSCDLGGGK